MKRQLEAVLLSSKLILLLGLMASEASAIEFVDKTRDRAWQCEQIETNHCKCHKEDFLKPSEIWVGLCKDELPQGKGYHIVKNHILLRLANKGRVINTGGAVDAAGLEKITEKKDLWADYFSVINARNKLNKGPNQTEISIKGQRFISTYPSAPEIIKKQVTQIMNADRHQQIESGYNSSLKSKSRDRILLYLEWWGNDISDQQKSRLKERISVLQREEDEIQRGRVENQKRAKQRAMEKEEIRTHMRQHACKQFYPGYVGRYVTTGILGSSTSDYVVRYVNAGQSRVTIEGRSSSLALKFGEMRELSCFNLWEQSK